ncbi:hypothetical protein BH11BAC4_BH11BAC4_03270 [soil metagenome]
MALEEFDKEELSEKDKGYLRMRSIMDYGMGVLWTCMGVFLLFIKQFHTGLETRYDDSTLKVFGSVCAIYGLFRIYRGYKKNYLKER